MLGEAQRLISRLLKSKLLTQSGLYFAGQAFQKAASFLLIPVWTYYLLPSDYGIIGTMGAYSNLLHISLMLGIYSSVVRHLFDFERQSQEQRSYVFSNFLFLFVVSGAAIAALSFLGQRWWPAVSSGNIPFQPFVTVTLWTVWAGIVARMLLTLYQAEQKALAYISLEALGFILSVAFGLALVTRYRMGAYGQILGSFIGQAAVMIVACVLMFREWFSMRFSWHHVRSALVFGLPLVPHLLSAWALTFVDRVMLEHYVPLRDVGFYNLGYNLGMGMLVLVTSVNQAYQPYYYGLMTSSPEPESKILRIVAYYLTGLGAITLFGSLFAGELITILTPSKYQNAAVFVPPILLSYLFVGLYYFVGSPLFYFKRTKLLPLITGTAAVLNIVLNLFLIPRYGAIAAAWTTLASYGVMLVIYYVVAQRIHKLKYPIVRYLILLSLLLAVVIVVRPDFDLQFTRLLMKLVACAVFAGIAYALVINPRFGKTTLAESRVPRE